MVGILVIVVLLKQSMLLKLCKNNKQNLKQEDERQQQISEIRSSALHVVLQCLNGGICLILQTYLNNILLYLILNIMYACTHMYVCMYGCICTCIPSSTYSIINVLYCMCTESTVHVK